VNDPDPTVIFPLRMDDDLRTRLSAHETADIGDRPQAGLGTGLISLSFITAALGRTKNLWCTAAVIGLLLGSAYIVARPPAYSATVSVLLADNPNETPANEVPVDMALAASIPVATAVVRQLGLSESPSNFAATYTVTALTYQVLRISVKGQSADDALRKASALATQFLKFRAQYEQTQLQESEVELAQQASQAQQQLDAIHTRISKLSATPNAPGQQAQMNSLKKQAKDATNNLAVVQEYVIQSQASLQTETQAMVSGSQVLNPAALTKRSALKDVIVYALGGLIGGLVVGMIIVVIGAVTSDRLRRRDDIAQVAGASVGLSVGPLRARRLAPRLPRQAAIRRRDISRVVDYLRNSVPGSSKGPAGLAVVAVDDTPTVARAVIDLAASRARESTRVIVADLSDGAHAARLLGVNGSGVSKVDLDGARILVVVPDRDDVAPVGPLESPASPVGSAQADEALMIACRDADLVLSLVDLDPAYGGEHLATWATEAVAVVTAGRSTAVRIHAVGEMIRLSGARLGSVVVLGADERDESLGLTSLSLLGGAGETWGGHEDCGCP
jgi:capsular polysaccharide biosynthesis protein